MDPQFKRGLLETCVLSVVSRGGSYGYQIIKDLAGCMEISESTLYPILKRLEANGLVTAYSVEHNGRLRRFYRITDPGRRRIQDFLENWQDVMTVYTFIREGVKP